MKFIAIWIALICFVVSLSDAQLAPTKASFLINEVELEFQFIESGKAHFVSKLGQPIVLELSELPKNCLDQILELSGWGRVWTSSGGKFSTVADLVDVQQSSVRLELANGSVIAVQLEKLSDADRKYVESRRGSPAHSLPPRFIAKVIGIVDGDTVDVLLNRRQFRIRISGIDSPEMGQDFSDMAKTFLENLVSGKVVVGLCESTDNKGRNACTLECEGRRVDHELLSNGLTWLCLKHSSDKKRAELERIAETSKLGIWSQPRPVAPWDWRKFSLKVRKEFQLVAKGISNGSANSNRKQSESLSRLPRSNLADSEGKIGELTYKRYSANLVWVDEYFRKDGTFVRGHWRSKPGTKISDSTKRNVATGRKRYSTSSNGIYYNNYGAGGYGSGGAGPVYVSGYHRSDGTYVRPHYRSRPRR